MNFKENVWFRLMQSENEQKIGNKYEMKHF